VVHQRITIGIEVPIEVRAIDLIFIVNETRTEFHAKFTKFCRGGKRGTFTRASLVELTITRDLRETPKTRAADDRGVRPPFLGGACDRSVAGRVLRLVCCEGDDVDRRRRYMTAVLRLAQGGNTTNCELRDNVD